MAVALLFIKLVRLDLIEQTNKQKEERRRKEVQTITAMVADDCCDILGTELFISSCAEMTIETSA